MAKTRMHGRRYFAFFTYQFCRTISGSGFSGGRTFLAQEAELVEVQVPKDRKVKMVIDLLAKYVAEVRFLPMQLLLLGCLSFASSVDPVVVL